MSSGEIVYWDTFLRSNFNCGGQSAVVVDYLELFSVLFLVVYEDILCRYSVCGII